MVEDMRCSSPKNGGGAYILSREKIEAIRDFIESERGAKARGSSDTLWVLQQHTSAALCLPSRML